MASTRDIRRRIKSVKNTAQITRAMQLVAAAKMKKAQDQALAGREYAAHLTQVLYGGGPPLTNSAGVPWTAAYIDSITEPTADLRQLLLEFFLNVYRDPRLHPQHWQQVNATASTIFRRWLARVSLDQFFDIISKNALDYHWRFRRQFWQAYLRLDAIDDAWIASKVKAQLLADGDVTGTTSDVDVKANVVTLTGTAETAAARSRAIELAGQTRGVRGVVAAQLLVRKP